MGKYTAGDRVKILAGHPYVFDGDFGEPAEGTYVAKESLGYRGKHHVLVDVEEGEPYELSFKGSEIELIVAAAEPAAVAATTVKVGDRVWDVVDGDKINEATVSAVISIGEFTANWDDGMVGEMWWRLSDWDGHAPAVPAPANDNTVSVHTLTLTLDSEPLVDAFRTIAAALNKAADDIAA